MTIFENYKAKPVILQKHRKGRIYARVQQNGKIKWTPYGRRWRGKMIRRARRELLESIKRSIIIEPKAWREEPRFEVPMRFGMEPITSPAMITPIITAV